jgi:hypothetical protein
LQNPYTRTGRFFQYDAPWDGAARGENQSNFYFLGGEIHLPEEVFLCVLGFLSKPELVHCVSLVSKAGLHSGRSPLLWPALGKNIWKRFPYRRDGGPPVKTLFSMKRWGSASWSFNYLSVWKTKMGTLWVAVIVFSTQLVVVAPIFKVYDMDYVRVLSTATTKIW